MGNLCSRQYVTRDEMVGHVKEALSDKDEQIARLTKELERVRGEYHKLQTSSQKAQSEREVVLRETSQVSEEAIDAFVQKILDDPELNIYLLPDAVEGAIYRNILRITLRSVAKMFDSFSVKVIGHQLRVVMEPVPADANVSPAPPK